MNRQQSLSNRAYRLTRLRNSVRVLGLFHQIWLLYAYPYPRCTIDVTHHGIAEEHQPQAGFLEGP